MNEYQAHRRILGKAMVLFSKKLITEREYGLAWHGRLDIYLGTVTALEVTSDGIWYEKSRRIKQGVNK